MSSPSADYDDDGKKCHTCGKKSSDGETLLTCGQCKRVQYCDKKCQKSDWNQHKKHCGPTVSFADFWAFVEQAKKDYALTDDEYRRMRLILNRMAGTLNVQKCDQGPSAPGYGDDGQTNLRIAFLYILDRRLLASGRGVRLSKFPPQKKMYEGAIAYVMKAIGEPSGTSRRYKVELANNGSSENLTLRLDQMSMLPLNDPRHYKGAMDFDADPGKVFPPEVDAEWANRQLQYTPVTEGHKWEYLDTADGDWKEYSKPVQYLIETLYDMGSHHCLYRPGAPHCEGNFESWEGIHSTDPECPMAGNIWFLGQHDSATRQIIFCEHTRTSSPLMTERDLYTGMRRPVRRSGPLPPPENDFTHERDLCGPEYHFKDNTRNDGSFCGLCYSSRGPFTQTECCGNWVCDTEDCYEIGSYERQGQCMRNHRLGSICAYHHREGHKGNWKDCTKCIDEFRPYDYAVKASSMAASGTCRRYNFDDNVHHDDLDLTTIDFPVCDSCGEPVDTTEETTRTLCMRQMMACGKNFCKFHGGGFGVIKNLLPVSSVL